MQARTHGMLLITLLLTAPAALEAQVGRTTALLTRSQNYEIQGIQAWSAARSNGFTFRPIATAEGQTVSRPHDGVNTRLRGDVKDMRFGGLRTVRRTLGSVVGGNMSVSQPTTTVTFEMFGGRTLAPGWSVQRVELAGD